MTFRTLIRRSLRHHWRAHLGVLLGAAIGSAALIGALVVGDSVRESLRRRALERLGNVYHAVFPQDRLFRSQLAGDFNHLYTNFYGGFHDGSFAPAFHLPATAVSEDGSARANHVNILGVDAGWLKMGGDSRCASIPPGKILLNETLARQLHASFGDIILVRMSRPTSFSAELPISPRSEQTTALRVEVAGVVSSEALGNFNLRSGQESPLNAFVALPWLQEMSGLTNRANRILTSKWEVDLTRPLTHFERYARMLKQPTEHVTVETRTGAYNAVIYRAQVSADILNADYDWQRVWKLADVEANLRLHLPSGDIELSSPRVFIDQAIQKATQPNAEKAAEETARRLALDQQDIAQEILMVEAVSADAHPLLTYLANLLQAGTNATPYSMVTAAGEPWTPADMRDDEILVSQWVADDLRVKAGDEVALSYFDPESGARLVEHTNVFRVRGIVPMEMPWADRTLMPDFPGLEKAESTRDWDAGFPLTYKIRQKDEDYWKQFRGTPKAFVTLAAGQKMWANRFGNLTAIRFPIPTDAPLTPVLSPSEEARVSLPPPDSRSSGRESGPSSAAERESRLTSAATLEEYRAALEKKILANLKPEELGLRFEPVREQALKAAEQSQDFGGLFIGFSFFLIAAALLLMTMLFQLGLEQRAPEIGTLLALGFTPKDVRKLLLGEGVALALGGGVLGALGGLAYANVMLHGLATVWRDAVGATTLSFHVTMPTLVIGLFASVAVSAVTIWLALRKFVRREPRELLAGEVEEDESRVRSSKSRVLASAALLVALGLVGWTLAKGDTANAGAFFGVGALVLIAGLSFVSAWLANVLRTSCPQNHLSSSIPETQKYDLPAGCRKHVSLGSLGLRGCVRRRKRSLATVAMLACGSFLIVSIGVFRLDANRDATQRNSGTGGFALIGETTMPVVQDLNSPSDRDFFALKEEELQGVSFVPFRVREGDEASCLNLNRAQKPRLLGVKPEFLEGRFTIASMIHGPPRNLNWRLLKSPPEPWGREGDVPLVPAIGDANSVRWALGKKLGDTIEYRDAQGRPFKVWIVATVANSILQGQLLIDEAEFVKRFPDESGYRQFLMDVPTNRMAEVSATLSRAMQDVGLELTPAARRLAQFNAVQNTYLGTFQVLGGLGLLLGSVGLGIVVLRNVLERRGELAVLLAVGFRKPTLQSLLLIENGALLGLGLLVGVLAAAVAVLPALLSPGTQLPWLTLALTLAAVLLNGALWTWAATRAALRGDLLAALRNE